MPTRRSYGDACGIARALDVVGERWALLVVRELLLGPQRFSDLRRALPGASSNLVADRLRELEGCGVIRRRTLAPPAGSRVYELTEWGRELEPIVTGLGAWGARSPFPPDSEEIGADSIVLALRSLFDPEAAGKMVATYELRLGEDLFHVDVGDWEIALHRGAAGDADAAIETDPGTLAAILTGQLPLEEGLKSGTVAIEGSRRAVGRFLKLFPMPQQCAVAAAEEREAVAV